jgi:small subunit ribosomal protein S9
MAVETAKPIQTVGRRKTSVARATMRPGTGVITVNGREFEEYFPRFLHRSRALEPFVATETEGQVDIQFRVNGGGISGQADAIRMALARAIVEVDEENRPALRSRGLLTRDARKVERKKPGRPKARKRFQFSKR